MEEIVKSLSDAPVMNLFVLVGFVLVALAAVGRVKAWRLDLGGRLLAGGCGTGMLVVAAVIFLGLKAARATVPEDRTPAAPAVAAAREERAARAEQPAPLAAAAPAAEVVLPAKEQYGEWGCQETKTITASLVLPEGKEFRSAAVDVVGIANATFYRRLPLAFDPKTRTVTGAVEVRGLDRVFFNCPGGGHATVRLAVTAVAP